MACLKTLSINEAEVADMPLNQAVYVPSNGGYIVGARPGRIFKLNATTGEKIYERQWYGPTEFFAGIAYHAPTDRIYAALSAAQDQGADLLAGFGTYPDVEGIYSFNPADLSAGPTKLNLDTLIYNDFVSFYFLNGPYKLMSAGDWLVLQYGVASRIMFNPSSAGVYINLVGIGDPWASLSLTDFAWHDPTDTMMMSDQNYPGLHIWDVGTYPTGGFPHNGTNYDRTPIPWRDDFNAYNAPYLCGICYSPTNNTVYATTGTDLIYKANLTAQTFNNFFALGRSAAKPYHIRYNSVNGLIYVPCWTDDTVCVIDPSDDSVTVKTGFDCPVDMVFTPTKIFAVQAGPAGLKEVV